MKSGECQVLFGKEKFFSLFFVQKRGKEEKKIVYINVKLPSKLKQTESISNKEAKNGGKKRRFRKGTDL